MSAKARREKVLERFERKIEGNTKHLAALSTESTNRLVLAALFMAEGSKRTSGSVVFGNSSPSIIQLYLALLRECFALNEEKFRCTLQARADQDIAGLEKFWVDITAVPSSQFYKARIDPRSVGRETRKTKYKGVCRVEYLSVDLLSELNALATLLRGARSSAG